MLHVEMFENRKVNEGQTVDKMFDLKDAVLMPDTLRCKKTLDNIVRNGNHYIVKVKGNQPSLRSAEEETIVNSVLVAFHQEEKIAGNQG